MGAAVLIAPIFTALMSALLLRDRVGVRGWFGVALGFIGVLMISRPGSDVFQPAIVLPVIAGLCYSMTAVLTRAKLQHVNTIGVALSLNTILLIFSGVTPRSYVFGKKVSGDAHLFPSRGGRGTREERVVEDLAEELTTFRERLGHTVLRSRVLMGLLHVLACPLSKRQRGLYEDYMSASQTRSTLGSGPQRTGESGCFTRLSSIRLRSSSPRASACSSARASTWGWALLPSPSAASRMFVWARTTLGSARLGAAGG